MSGGVIIAVCVIAAYLIITLCIGIFSSRNASKSSEGYFMAQRSLGPYVMFFTLFATNISAFAYLGGPGGAYHLGLGFFGFLATTTSMAAVFFYIIGFRSWLIGKKFGYMTPAQLFGKRYASDALRILIFLVLGIFTLAYMVVQPIGAGYIVSGLTQNVLPTWVGVVMILIFVTLYVFIGGLRATAYADLFQGLVMMVCVVAAFGLIVYKLGGMSEVTQNLVLNFPELIERKNFTVQNWFSFALVIGLAIPVFPQLFTKFLAAKSSDSLRTTMSFYPLAMILIYVPVLFLGVYGHTVFPDLIGKQSDQIIPLLLGKYYPLWIGAVILSAVLAAIMSTLGAQLITISTMFTKDVYVRYIDKNASQEKQVLVGRFFILVLALTTTAIALKPPAAILSIVSWAFTGYAVLTPTVLAGLYWKRSTAKGAISSIIAGESVLVLFAAGIIPMSVLQGFQVIIPVISTTVIVLVVVSLLTQQEGEEKESAERTHQYLDSVLSENETIIGTPIPALASNVSIQKSK